MAKKEEKEKDPAAVDLGRRGGEARAKALSKKRKREIAVQAAESRWGGASSKAKAKKEPGAVDK